GISGARLYASTQRLCKRGGGRKSAHSPRLRPGFESSFVTGEETVYWGDQTAGLESILLMIKKAQRIQELPPYLFAEIDKKKNALKARGVDIISLGIGDPDLPTPPHIVERLRQAAGDPANHCYPDYEGLPAFRQAIADWYRARFGVVLDPDREVVSL